MNADCCICSQIIGDKSNDLIYSLLQDDKYKKRILFEDDNFVLFPSIGGLTFGHSIICPKLHVKNLLLLKEDTFSKLDKFKQKCIRIIKKHTSDSIHFFEHGSSQKTNKIICTVEHAHLHLVPANVSILDEIFNQYNWFRLDEFNSQTRDLVKQDEYIFYESPDKELFITIGENYESQYMRKIFARKLGIENKWNWREFPETHNIKMIYDVETI